jgi:ATP-binding cassette, subfamily B, multidrug efflux pump
MSRATRTSPHGGPPPGALSVRAFHEEADTDRPFDWKLLLRAWAFLKPQGVLLAIAFALMPITSGVALLQPLLLKQAIDAAVIAKSSATLSDVVLMYTGVLAIEFFTRFGQVYLMQLAGQKTMAGLRRHVFGHIQRLPVKYFDRTPVGRIVTRVTNDIDALSEFFASGAVTAVADLITLAGIVVFMLALDWELSLIAFLALPPLAFFVTAFRRYARRAFRDIRTRIAQLNAFLAEQVSGIAVVQAFGREERCGDEYAYINGGYRDANFRAIRYDALLYSVVESVAVASLAVVLYYASHRVAGASVEHAALQIGTVVAFYEYIQRFFIPIRDLSTKYTIIQSSLASAERIFGLLDVHDRDAERRDVEDVAREDRPPIVRFANVTFAYREGHPVLHDVSFDVKEGETVALVGATGSGKTTVTALLMRLYDHDEGRIELRGREIQSLDRSDLRRRFALVPQELFLFRGTVAENIALGASPDRERVLAALAAVGATEFVLARAGGIESSVEERGSNFSAGERQLLAFARALYRDPEILVLDEATAHVDSETEAKLQHAVLELLRGRTSLVIAHRLSTIEHADRILVFHKGRIAEQGNHEDLLALDGIYARLYRLQFAASRTAEGSSGEAPEAAAGV